MLEKYGDALPLCLDSVLPFFRGCWHLHGHFHLNLLSNISSVISPVNASPQWITVLNSSSQLLCLRGLLRSYTVCVVQRDCLILSIPLVASRWLFLSFCPDVSPPDSDSYPIMGLDCQHSSTPTEGRSSPSNIPIFPLFPSSYRVIHGSFIFHCQTPVPPSTDVLRVLLFLKVFWCIVRGIPCPPTPHHHLLSCYSPF